MNVAKGGTAPAGVAVLAVFATAMAVVLLFLSLLSPADRVNENSDYLGFYRLVAGQILERHAPVFRDGSPALRYPPGYPLVLAVGLGLGGAVGLPEGPMLVGLHAAAVATACSIAFLFSSRLWGRRGGLVTAALLMTYPLLLWLTKQPNSETVFLPFLLGSVFCCWTAAAEGNNGATFASGILAGCAMLVRPMAIGLSFVLAGFLWAYRRLSAPGASLRAPALLLVGTLIVVLPWEGWVWARTGRVILLSGGGTPSIRDGLSFGGDRKAWRQPIALPAELRAFTADVDARYGTLNSGKAIAAFLVEELRSRPVAVLQLVLWKAARAWYATDSGRWDRLALAIQGPYLLLFLWSSIRAWRAGRWPRALVALVGVIVLYSWAMSMVAFSIVRYLTPAICLFFVLVPAVGLPRLVPRSREVEG
jgi:4-amino-4-deoxy-L-arabinose transferase-like glycosyltransferase